ncbi:MAG: NarK/NasA family nitrate transporter [Burkholderiaceae bacterium]|uniref:NarK/NasA family nitrate transporter n=1 Tax=Cupriavidus metallidurans TaxID=119219 RepID=A0A482IQM1_9BURK|nr:MULTISPECIES: nitrate/nitrite transporter [Cupriavidus]KWR81923.1 MFS transporter [Cupriavidus sp. SHE]PCH58824.1 MAG: NarK/NasA family nitrate transporter [Burkholderiaceae bacterium]QBP10246.1 NarK/NasA family nitrate transporter [Cupriavidus metallidurans]QWC87321.1 NarK/NasA family nitrate transporter [Cupriavidus metallidurans]
MATPNLPSSKPEPVPSGAWTTLWSSTFAFTICFAVWMLFAVLGIPLKKELGLNDTEFGLLAATPVLSGSLIRVPLGIWTDRYGGRVVFFVLMLLTVIPIWLISYAHTLWQLLVLGLFVGLAGGSFSVGTPYVARWFPRSRQGLAMGIFGAGNSGAALTKFVAPALILAAGTWEIVPRVYSVAMLITAIVFWLFSRSNPAHRVSSATSWRAQLAVMRDPRVWRYSQYYSVVFGGYVGLSLWMTKYYIGEYGFDMKTAAFLAACFSLPGGVLRAIGGWISDRYGAHRTTWWVMWVSWVTFFLLSYPRSDFTIHTANGPESFHIALSPTVFTILMFVVGIAFAVGKASVFKFISNDFTHNIGAVSGVVGLAGGLGGFILPILFGALADLTGIRTSCFMLMYGAVCVSLVWMHYSQRAANARPTPETLQAA